MGKSAEHRHLSHSSSASSSTSQDFEFTVSLSPVVKKTSPSLCPADDLFFKGQLLPLHLPPRLHAIQTLITPSNAAAPPPPSPPTTKTTTTRSFSRSSGSNFPIPPPPALTHSAAVESSGWSSEATSSRDSNSSSCDSSRRPSSATTDDDDPSHPTTHKKFRHFARFPHKKQPPLPPISAPPLPLPPPPAAAAQQKPQPKATLSSIFITKSKKMSKSAKQVFQKYLNKMKPLYDKISHHRIEDRFVKGRDSCSSGISYHSVGSHSFHGHTHSFSGNLRSSKRKGRGGGHAYAGSCPSSMRSSPSHSGVLSYGEFSSYSMDSSSMQELHSAIQGAIAHCKSSVGANDGHGEYDTVITL
ncbi:probable membrane-associated kinase regulator 1 [Nymphaea colorata]|nr:probable membrane-associated kinase regulator 1 [Nymphaea colorata]